MSRHPLNVSVNEAAAYVWVSVPYGTTLTLIQDLFAVFSPADLLLALCIVPLFVINGLSECSVRWRSRCHLLNVASVARPLLSLFCCDCRTSFCSTQTHCDAGMRGQAFTHVHIFIRLIVCECYLPHYIGQNGGLMPFMATC